MAENILYFSMFFSCLALFVIVFVLIADSDYIGERKEDWFLVFYFCSYYNFIIYRYQ